MAARAHTRTAHVSRQRALYRNLRIFSSTPLFYYFSNGGSIYNHPSRFVVAIGCSAYCGISPLFLLKKEKHDFRRLAHNNGGLLPRNDDRLGAGASCLRLQHAEACPWIREAHPAAHHRRKSAADWYVNTTAIQIAIPFIASAATFQHTQPQPRAVHLHPAALSQYTILLHAFLFTPPLSRALLVSRCVKRCC